MGLWKIMTQKQLVRETDNNMDIDIYYHDFSDFKLLPSSHVMPEDILINPVDLPCLFLSLRLDPATWPSIMIASLIDR